MAPGNTAFSSGNDLLQSGDGTRVRLCPAAMAGNCAIPESVIYIDDNAFKNCKDLTSVTIPRSVQIIGASAEIQRVSALLRRAFLRAIN